MSQRSLTATAMKLTLLALLPLLGGADQSAAPPSEGGTAAVEAWHVDAEVLTDVPIMVGGRITLETPDRLRLSTALGVMPGAYVDLINDTALAFEWYGEPTAALIEAVVDNSLVSRTHAGWRPFAERGFYMEAGYTFVGLSSGTVDDSDLTGATGVSGPSGGGNSEFDVGAQLHMLDVELGWRWALWEQLAVRAALGGAFTVSSSATVERTSESGGGAALWSAFESASEEYLVDTFESYGHSVVASIAVGWRFF